MNTNSKIMMVVAIVVALGVGVFAGTMVNKDKDTHSGGDQKATASNIVDSKAATLRVDLNDLLREHVSTSLAVTRTIVDGAPQKKLEGAKAAQTANAVAIAKAVGSIYGQDAQDAITPPFVEHIAQSNNYAAAVKAGDQAAQDKALAALQTQLHKVADVFHSVIPSVPSDALYDALNAHEDLLNQSATAYNNGDYKKAYELEAKALVQISGGADVLTTGIIKSKPEMFN